VKIFVPIKYGSLCCRDSLKARINHTDIWPFCISVASGNYPVWIHRYLSITITN